MCYHTIKGILQLVTKCRRPLAAYSLEGWAVSDLYKKNRDRIPSFMRYVPKDGEQLVYEDIYIPDVDSG
jgi:hypothetical protein